MKERERRRKTQIKRKCQRQWKDLRKSSAGDQTPAGEQSRPRPTGHDQATIDALERNTRAEPSHERSFAAPRTDTRSGKTPDLCRNVPDTRFGKGNPKGTTNICAFEIFIGNANITEIASKLGLKPTATSRQLEKLQSEQTHLIPGMLTPERKDKM